MLQVQPNLLQLRYPNISPLAHTKSY